MQEMLLQVFEEDRKPPFVSKKRHHVADNVEDVCCQARPWIGLFMGDVHDIELRWVMLFMGDVH